MIVAIDVAGALDVEDNVTVLIDDASAHMGKGDVLRSLTLKLLPRYLIQIFANRVEGKILKLGLLLRQDRRFLVLVWVWWNQLRRLSEDGTAVREQVYSLSEAFADFTLFKEAQDAVIKAPDTAFYNFEFATLNNRNMRHRFALSHHNMPRLFSLPLLKVQLELD